MQSQNYQRTMIACFIAYMVQAVVNNFVPLLFVTFQQTYDIPMAKITLLITLNFLIQLVVDLLSAGFVDKIGYRASVILAHICAAAGFVLLTILPEMLSDPVCRNPDRRHDLCRRRRIDRSAYQPNRRSLSDRQ